MPPTRARNIRIPDQEWQVMQALAKAQGITVSDMIRTAVRMYVRDHTPREDTS